jgi:xylulokinase
MIFVGADIGTTRIKAIAYCDERRRALANASLPTPVVATEYGSAHSPSAIVEQLRRCLDTVLDALPDRRDVRAICVASLGEEVVLVDERGAALGVTPTWYDSPGRAAAAGHPSHGNPTFSLFTLRWFADQHPALIAATARFTDLGSFVAAWLSDRAADLVMDHSHASRTGFFDVQSRSFRTADLSWAGDWAAALPELVPSGAVIGQLSSALASTLGLDSDVLVVSGAHDHFAAAFASGVRTPGDAMLSAGTSEALLVLTIEAPKNARPGIDIGAFVDEETSYLHRNVRAGHLFASWRALLHLPDEPAADWFEPTSWRDAGQATPLCIVDAECSTATISNIPFEAEPLDVMRAVSEGLAVNASSMLADLETEAGAPVPTLTVAGPATEQHAWLRLRASVLGRPLRVVRTPEPTALGAALLAQRAVRGTADIPVDIDIVEPTSAPEAVGYYARLREAYGKISLRGTA